ncbi:MAG: T9SS type A sorting domain-containing protein, partial [Phaeodactylibacter sp.]|nr:T9SS type A sorting domain-containing protein [Phaeodactylibacter sp.]
PNPASTRFTIAFNRPLPARGELILYDALGRGCARFPLIPGARQASFDISSRPAGLYFYEVRSEAGRLGAGKLLIVD